MTRTSLREAARVLGLPLWVLKSLRPVERERLLRDELRRLRLALAALEWALRDSEKRQ